MKNNFEIFKFDFLKKNKKDKNVNLDEIAELKFSIDKKTNTLLIDNYAEKAQSSQVNTINDAISNSKETNNSNVLINEFDSYNRKNIQIDPMVDISLETTVEKVNELNEATTVQHENIQEENSSNNQPIETKSDMNVIHFDLDSMADPNATSSVLNKTETNLSDEEIENMIEDDNLNHVVEEQIIENTNEEKMTPISINKNSDIDSMHKVIFELDPMSEPEIVSSVDNIENEKMEDSNQELAPLQNASSNEENNTQEETQEEVDDNLVEASPEENNVKEEYIENEEESSNLVEEQTIDDDFSQMFDGVNDYEQNEIKQEDNDISRDEDQQINKFLNEEDFNEIKSEEVDNLIEEDLLIIDEFFKKEVNRQENDLIAKSFSDKL